MLYWNDVIVSEYLEKNLPKTAVGRVKVYIKNGALMLVL